MTDEEIAARIIEASRKFEDLVNGSGLYGGDLTTGEWGVMHTSDGWRQTGCACPIGALLLVEQPPIANEVYVDDDGEEQPEIATAMVFLERSQEWVNGFVLAIDGFRAFDSWHPDSKAGHACGLVVKAALDLRGHTDPGDEDVN